MKLSIRENYTEHEAERGVFSCPAEEVPKPNRRTKRRERCWAYHRRRAGSLLCRRRRFPSGMAALFPVSRVYHIGSLPPRSLIWGLNEERINFAGWKAEPQNRDRGQRVTHQYKNVWRHGFFLQKGALTFYFPMQSECQVIFVRAPNRGKRFRERELPRKITLPAENSLRFMCRQIDSG